MQSRTIESVLEEFEAENHRPMLALVEALRNRLQGKALKYDVSMLRLWLARYDASNVQVMVAYGDGRGGGRASAREMDSYELTFFEADTPSQVSIQGLTATVDLIEKRFA